MFRMVDESTLNSRGDRANLEQHGIFPIRPDLSASD